MAACGSWALQADGAPTSSAPAPAPADALVRALYKIVNALPDLLPRVQALLLDLLSLVLARRPFSPATPSTTVQALQGAVTTGELQGAALTRLALQTLGGFNLVPHQLLDFVRDYVVPYLDDNDASLRRAAALAACHVLEEHVQHTMQPGRRLASHDQRAVDKVRAGWLGQVIGLAGQGLLPAARLERECWSAPAVAQVLTPWSC